MARLGNGNGRTGTTCDKVMATERSQTANIKVFERPGPESVLYDFQQPGSVTITLPAGSKWTSGPHWHETHTEFLQVLQGRAFVRLGLRAGVYGPDDGVIEVPRYTVHEWHRPRQEDNQEELIVREWTMPVDGQKEVFFRNLNSFLMEPQPTSMYSMPHMVPKWVKSLIEGWVIQLQLFCIFRSWDNWPVFVGDDSGWISWLVTHIILGVGSIIGAVLGLRGSYPDYVNEELMARVSEQRGKHDARKTR